MSDSSYIIDIDRENKKGKRRDYIKHAKLRGLAHKNHVNKNVPERSTGPDYKCRLHCYSKVPLQVPINIIERINAFDPKDGQDVCSENNPKKKFK